VLDLYALEVLAATGNPHIPAAGWPNTAVYVPEYQRRHIKRTEQFELCLVGPAGGGSSFHQFAL